MSRLENTTKNFIWSTVSTMASSILGFISRTAFIYFIGTHYLGVNSLFTELLSMLSLAELGLGVAINFSLYKPLSQNNIEEVKSLMMLYKKAYRIIGIIIAVVGISLTPFLNYLIKGGQDIPNIKLIYLVFLFNTSYSYLFSYKRTLLSADQKSYLMTNIDMIISICTLLLQIIFLFIFKNYYVYLAVNVIVGISQNFYVNSYINRRYPYLLEKNVEPLSKENKDTIVKNVKAMILHKLGDLCINQTDNIIISSFISIQLVGLVSNYNLIINMINKFCMNLFNAANASLGNLIATENNKKRYEVFKGYNFMAFWIFGWCAICFAVLLNPFITLWIGKENTINQSIIILVIINFYLVGMRIPVANVKAAAGLYVQDQFVPIIQSVVNLVISVIGAKTLGLTGVYLGTVISSLVLPCWYRPILIYKYIFDESPKSYFKKYIIYIFVILINYFLVDLIVKTFIGMNITFITLIQRGIICLVIPNVIIYMLFRKSEDFKYIISIINRIKSHFLERRRVS